MQLAEALASEVPGITGGAGGQVLFVTHTNDSGAGNLRAALTAEGRRIVVITAAGACLPAGENIPVTEGDLTVIGCSDSFVLRRVGLDIMSDNVILHNVRIRGDGQNSSPGNQNCLHITGDHVLIDHCDLMWATDQLINPYDCTNVVIQWCILSEALRHANHPEGAHSKGVFLWRGLHALSLRCNLISQNIDRNPLLAGGDGIEIINNFLWNTGNFLYVHPVNGACRAHISGNFMQAGADTWVGRTFKYGLRCVPNTYSAQSRLYLTPDNLAPTRPNNSLPAQAIAPASEIDPLFSALPLFPERTSVMDVLGVREAVCAGAGAMPRDAQAARVIADALNGVSRMVDNPEQVGGWL